MTLSPGTRFGPYEISAEIGAGGMGVVYRATDTTLDREVAIKVLPESMASDAERISRFDREAKMLASLNHPNIAQIYGLERSDDTTALVMELVEGPTLADRIEQGALPADEALGRWNGRGDFARRPDTATSQRGRPAAAHREGDGRLHAGEGGHQEQR